MFQWFKLLCTCFSRCSCAVLYLTNMYLWLGAFGIFFLCVAISELFKHLIGPKEEKKEEIEDKAEPKFSTTLSTPIEDIIEETISEELADDITTKKKSQTKKGSVKPAAKIEGKISEKTKKKPKEPIDEDSFFIPKTVGKTRTGDNSSNFLKKVEDTEASPVDDIGFSFLPVKTKGKKYKNSHEKKDTKSETLNAVVEKTIRKSKEDNSKPSIIDHYKPNRKHQAVIETVPVVTNKFTNNLERVQQFVNVHRLEEQRSSENLIKEYKESKKVTSGVSYASIAKNSPETLEKSEGSTDPIVKYQEPVPELALSGLQVYIEPEKSVCFPEQSQITVETSNQENQFDLIKESDKLVECNGIQNDLLIDEITSTQEDIRSKNSSICVLENFDSDDEQGLILSNLNEFVSIEQKLNSQKKDPTKESSRSKNSSICVIGSLSDPDDLDDEATLLTDSAQKFIEIETENIQPSAHIKDFDKTLVSNTKVEITNGIEITEEYNSEPVPKVDLVSSVANSFETGGSVSLEYTTEHIEKNNSINSRNFKATKFSFEIGDSSENSTGYIPIASEEVSQIQIEVDNIQPVINSLETVEKVDSGDLLAEVESQIETTFTENRCELSPQDNRLSDLEQVILTAGQDYEPFVQKPVDTLTKQAIQATKNLIEEEICVKKFAYTTGTEVGKTPDTTLSKKLLYTNMQPVRVLTLNAKEHQDCTLYRIEKNWVLQFRIGPSLFGRKLYLYCNYPVEQNHVLTEFKRSRYQLLEWVCDEGCQNADDTVFYAQITTRLAGSFHFYFTYENDRNSERQGSGYVLVDPVLNYGNDEILPLDCIQCQTVLAKNLGSFSTWEDKLRVTKESGYNMIHFTPIQQLGESNSCYSLSEQLKLNPQFRKNDGNMPTFEEVEKLTTKLRKEWKVASICDIVLNHTANESEWILEHPEVTYNCVNCPYLRPAYLLDAALHQFSMDVKRGLYEDRGIPSEVCTEDHLNAIRYHFRTAVLDPLNIPELFICDVNKNVTDFLTSARTATPISQDSRPNDELKLQQDPEFRRLAAKIDMNLALKLYNIYWSDTFDEESRLKKCAEEFKKKLDSLNSAIIEEVKGHLNVAIENVITGIRYYRVQADGPRFKEISIKCPLVYRYFTDYGTPKNLEEHESIMYSKNGRFLMAHNGWVMNSDPLRNFAAADSKVYVRRELIAWGDSVKLRFGDKPEDCPFLWDYMRKYVEQTARIFDGVRLDNCHSTPIPVAEYLLDCARRVRPDLYVVAELFTNSDMTDNIFVNRLGITSLIREAMSAWDSHEEGRLVYRYGGSPVGSFYQPSIRPLVPSIAHALFLDLTHDNPSPVEKRSVFDMLPSTALVNMACCASGSNRGYDELVPHHIHVVDETREYAEWTNDENLAAGNLRYVTAKTGIIRARKSINELHFLLGKEGFSQVYVDQMDPDIVAVTRHCPETHQSYILVAFTAFSHPDENSSSNQRGIKPLRFEGILDEIVIEATLNHFNLESQGSKFAKFEKFLKDSRWINGLSEYYVSIKEHIQVNESDVFEKANSGTANVTQLNFKNFKPGSIVVIKASLPESVQNAIKTVRNLIDTFSLTKPTSLNTIISKMSLSDLNRALYRCDQEERDEGYGFDTYNIPNFGSMVYAGLQGFMSLLANIRPNNDLGHPMCVNLRGGNWMIDYVWKRLKLDKGTKELGEWIEKNTMVFENIPRYLVPCYFDLVITGIYVMLLEHSYKLMSSFVEHGSTFAKGLSMGSIQFGAYIKSANLPTLSPNLAPPKPPVRENEKGELEQASVTLSAGLPHFSVGYTRNWGRDTFIALRGLFILTGRYQETREMILGYGACLRHGLIPNLLDGGKNSRYNCRDAVWWWLYCIKEYVEETPNGTSILSDKVSRVYPEDDSPAQLPGAVDQPLYDVMQEALRVHFQGLVFRERNAGRQIDEHMTDQGFNNQIGIHPETGFVFGGNRWNCGTWMDKMGSSEKAGNKGKPATPRDGSAVELVGLLKCVVSWLAKLNRENKYPYSGVERKHKNGNVTQWTFQEWSDKIQANFEKYFWVNSQPINGELRPDLINKRGIYKDSYGSSYEYTDFQLRCNFPIAMVAAPELFTAQNAWAALAQVEKYLLGPLGMKTLDPEDWAYRGDYDNSNDSNDPSVANGFNYHQGPEWLWPIGYYLRAKLQFAAQNGALQETLASTKLVLARHFTELQTSDWRGLPELTNSNGSYCKDSSRTQAWSMACVLEVLYDLQKIESSQSIVN